MSRKKKQMIAYWKKETWRKRPPRRRVDKDGAVVMGTSNVVWEKVMARDNNRCGYCGKSAGQVDHIFPIWHGGKSVESNLVAACSKCNYEKRASTDLEWMEKLRRHGSSTPRRTARIFLARGSMFPIGQCRTAALQDVDL